MKIKVFICTGLLLILFFSSCKNRTVQLLSKKWDCVKVENLDAGNTPFQTAQDSLNVIQLKTVLESLSWTFNSSMEYVSSVAGKPTIQGTYELLDDEKTLICTPASKNNINRYTINILTENDLVLRSNTGNPPVILYFKPH